MRTVEANRNAGRVRIILAVILGLCAVSGSGFESRAADVFNGTYDLTWDRDVEKTAVETTDVRKLKQILELKYKGLLSPIVKNEFSFKIEQEINSDAADTTRFLPTLDLGFKGTYWDAKAGAKRTHENSDEPGKNPKVTDSYYVEAFYLAPKTVPDFKGKYAIDTDFEEGSTDTRKDAITLSSVYKPTEWLDLKGDFSKTASDDRLQVDADTKEQKRSAKAAVRHLISEKIKIDVQYAIEETRGGTLLDAGGLTNKKEDETHTLKNALFYRPFEKTSLDGTYDLDIKQNMVTGEHTLTTNAKARVQQNIARPFDVKGEFNRNISDVRHTQDENEKTEDIWTIELRSKLSKLIDVSLKYQDKDILEDHVDPAKDKTSGTLIRNATWTGELTSFWKASASYERTDTEENDRTTVVDSKYGLKSTFDFKKILLTLNPSYDITLKDDFVKPEESETRDFKFKIAWTAVSTRHIVSKMEHTYGRKTDSAAHNIQRTDDSTGSVTVKDGIPGWTFVLDATRAATDTSGDDLPADISSTFGFKADLKYSWFSLNTRYKFDKNSLSDDGDTFDAKAGWTAPKWNVSLTYTLDRIFSADLNEKYSISLAFKYKL